MNSTVCPLGLNTSTAFPDETLNVLTLWWSPNLGIVQQYDPIEIANYYTYRVSCVEYYPNT